MKTEQIYQTLRNDMICGKLPAGSKLPPEEELAASFGVARRTLRSALAMLEEEGRLKRLRAHGTFVCPPKISNQEKVLSVLIPYPGFISRDIFENSASFGFFKLFSGATLAAAQNGWRVQAVPFSKTNDPQDIDYESLECLQEDSRLIVTSRWYRFAFDLFLQRKIRIGYVNNSFFDFPQETKYLNHWFCWLTSVEDITRKVIRVFHGQKGCRRVVSLSMEQDSLSLLDKSFYEDCKKAGICYKEGLLSGNEEERLQQTIRICKETKADLLIIRSGEFKLPSPQPTLHQYFDLPESVQIFSMDEEVSYKFNDYSYMKLDPFETGYQVAKKLMEELYVPEKFFYDRNIEVQC